MFLAVKYRNLTKYAVFSDFSDLGDYRSAQTVEYKGQCEALGHTPFLKKL